MNRLRRMRIFDDARKTALGFVELSEYRMPKSIQVSSDFGTTRKDAIGTALVSVYKLQRIMIGGPKYNADAMEKDEISPEKLIISVNGENIGRADLSEHGLPKMIVITYDYEFDGELRDGETFQADYLLARQHHASEAV